MRDKELKGNSFGAKALVVLVKIWDNLTQFGTNISLVLSAKKQSTFYMINFRLTFNNVLDDVQN